jgi:O-antigen/teichoic acid export membrane protein
MSEEMMDPLWVRLMPSPLRKKLSGRPTLFAILHNSGWLLFDKFVRILLGLFVGAWVARYLGPAEYGKLAYALAYIAFFSAIANLGMDGVIVRDIAQGKIAASDLLGTAFVLRIITGIICWLIAVGSIALTEDTHSAWLVALAGGSLVFQAADTVDLWFQSQSQSRRTVIAKIIAYMISNGAKIALILAKAPLIAFAAVMAADALIAAIGLTLAYRRYPSNGRWKFLTRASMKLLKESWPFMLSGFSVMVYMRIDQIMIKHILGERDLGIYSAALTLSQVMQVAPMIMATSLMPLVSQKRGIGGYEYQLFITQIFRVFFLGSMALALFLAVLAPFIVSAMFGHDYVEAVLVLQILIFSNVLISLGIAHGLWLINEKRSLVRLIGTAAAGCIAIIGNYFLLKPYGLPAAAFVTIISQFVAAVGINIFLDRVGFRMQLRAISFINLYPRTS